MILPFSTQFKDGTPTEFIEKIWTGLIYTPGLPGSFVLEEFDNLYRAKFGQSWDGRAKFGRRTPKLHTIREDVHDRWHKGCLIHPVVNNRSKNQFQFTPTIPCKSVQKIEVIYTNSNSDYPCVKIDDRLLYIWVKPDLKVLETLAKNDGFNSVEDFFAWFDHDYTGKIIHWTNLKY